jgi:hypothetical protein
MLLRLVPSVLSPGSWQQQRQQWRRNPPVRIKSTDMQLQLTRSQVGCAVPRTVRISADVITARVMDAHAENCAR